MEKFICIHSHFYQPPRENPWLEEVELQDSAFPFHDWNERIHAECYAQNAHSRILDGKGKVRAIVDNYEKISFNFGPTLLHWMRHHKSQTYREIVAADKKSRDRFSGHGSALAQVYNHIILPLANERDKKTQVHWGLRDFEFHFGRKPEGMWLAETAVNTDTLECLADFGVLFTVLAPRQALKVRPMDKSADWVSVEGGSVDPSRPYQIHLPSGKSIAVFFYDGPISQAVAFDGVLSDGERLAKKLLSAFDEGREGNQLVHVATDGETYGHHHRHGDMALAYALDFLERKSKARLTNYGEYLELNPPEWEAQIVESSSWSCAHGVERWRSDCGCNTGGHGDWNQSWRGPLRAAFDWLRDELAGPFEKSAASLLKDPWEARNKYIEVILGRDEANRESFFEAVQKRKLNDQERIRVLKLMELQRHALLMYTSCAWFFDELSGIETVQCIQYAGRVIQLAEQLFSTPVEERFLEKLQEAKSNLPENQDGRVTYNKFVKPAVLDFLRVGVHHAISSMFKVHETTLLSAAYQLERLDKRTLKLGKSSLSVERLRVRSKITLEEAVLDTAAVYLGGTNVSAGVRYHRSEDDYRRMAEDTAKVFETADMNRLMRTMGEHFEGASYGISSLFRDRQRKILEEVLSEVLDRVEHNFKELYDENAPLMRFLKNLGHPLPPVYVSIAEFVQHRHFVNAVSEEPPSIETLRAVLAESRRYGLQFEKLLIPLKLQECTEKYMRKWKAHPEQLELLKKVNALLDLEKEFSVPCHHWTMQNLYYEFASQLQDLYVQVPTSQKGEFTELLNALGDKLGMRREGRTQS